MQKRYYDIHVFYNRKDGFSVFLEIDSQKKIQSDDDIIIEAIAKGVLESEDSLNVDYVSEITEEEYKQAKNI